MCSRNDDPTTYAEDDVMEAGRLAGEFGIDADDRPAHTHRDDRDATDDCPACAWDIDHLGGAE